MNKSILAILTFAKVSVRRYFRDRVAMFFTVIFPLIFLFVFGGIFGKNSSSSFNIALINNSKTGYASFFAGNIERSRVFKVNKSIASLDNAKDKMSRSEIDATIVIPSDFGVKEAGSSVPSGQAVIYYDQNSEQAAQTIKTVLDGLAEHFNAHIVKVQTPFTVRTQPTNTKGLSRFDYTFSGLLGFSILGLGIFGPTNYFPQMKKQGILRRLHITPLKPWEFFTASALSNAVIGLFSIAVMFAVAFSVFHFHMAGNFIYLAVIVVLGIFEIFGIGLAIGGWARNENQAAPLANIVTFPMMFLSGTFFPRFLMPEWLQHITAFLPLTPVIDAIRFIATEGKTLTQIGSQIGLMLLWTVIIYLIAFRVFRWE
ncbi:MAG TPA: ABC transporter permease [Candidatus Saccharimonadales bacterium]|nr:ABC transporter permease [Candidatus Saccharimonadales bacterium]